MGLRRLFTPQVSVPMLVVRFPIGPWNFLSVSRRTPVSPLSVLRYN